MVDGFLLCFLLKRPLERDLDWRKKKKQSKGGREEGELGSDKWPSDRYFELKNVLYFFVAVQMLNFV